MPVYSFLEEYDFGAKTIIPFVTHGGSGFSGTLDTISELQPGAHVSDNTLSLSRDDVADGEEEVKEWAEGLQSVSVPVEVNVLQDMPHGYGSAGGWMEDYDRWLTDIFQNNMEGL